MDPIQIINLARSQQIENHKDQRNYEINKSKITAFGHHSTFLRSILKEWG
jgi:hypothetical protein